MSLHRERDRLQHEIDRLQRRLGSDPTDLRTPPGRSQVPREYSSVFYSDDPSRAASRDPMVSHLMRELASKKAETETLRSELQEQRLQHSRLRDIRVPTYDGKADFEEYLNQFIGICEFHRWTDEEAAIMLLAKLQGDALSVAAALNDQSLRSLILNLRKHFCSEQEEVATLKLSSRGQKGDESFQSLSFDIQRLTKKAYGSTDDETRDRIARDAFINAVSDNVIREKLRDQNPRTLADAVRESSRLSANRDLEKTRVKETVRQSSGQDLDYQQLRDEIEKLKQRRPRRRSSRPEQSRVAESQWRPRNPGFPPTCWKCYRKGHIARWCPFTDEEIEEMRAAGKIPVSRYPAERSQNPGN